ncbi:hypothetical protein GW915_03110 [bacterium]|nr:hypothetical protein [bacterium]
MPRKPLIRSSVLPYHIYNRSLDQQFYPVEANRIWSQCCDILRILSWANHLRVHSFVLMSNHYHLLASTPDENIDEIAGYFQSELSAWIKRETSLQRFRFSGRYKWSIISNARHYYQVYDYIHQNPIRAGICAKAQDYPYSSFSGIQGRIDNFPPIYSHPLFQDSGEVALVEDEQRANNLMSQQELNRTRLGLRRYKFLPPSRPRDGKR